MKPPTSLSGSLVGDSVRLAFLVLAGAATVISIRLIATGRDPLALYWVLVGALSLVTATTRLGSAPE